MKVPESALRIPRRPGRRCVLATGKIAADSLVRALCRLALVSAIVVASPAHAQKFSEPKPEPDRFRGQIVEVNESAIVLKSASGPVRLGIPDNISVFSLTNASFTDVDFGIYVGSVSVKLDKYSPIIRDSLSYLHQGFELRIIDENLRGIALGHTAWDLTPYSVISHGWVDDLEVRVLSIKYGPTEEEETDVNIPRNVPVFKMALGDRSLLKPGAHVFAGALKGASGDYSAVYFMVGQGGIVPAM